MWAVAIDVARRVVCLSVGRTVEPMQKRLNLFVSRFGWTCVGQKKQCIRWDTYGRHLENKIELSMLGVATITVAAMLRFAAHLLLNVDACNHVICCPTIFL